MFFADYRVQFYYWDFIRMLLRLLISVAYAVYYLQYNLKSCIIVLLIIGYNFLIYFKKPHTKRSLRDIELMCGYVQIINILCLLMLYQTLHEAMQVIYMLVFLIVNLPFFICLVYGMVK